MTMLLLEFVEIVEKRLKQMKIERLKLFINEKSQRGCIRWALPGLIFFFFSFNRIGLIMVHMGPSRMKSAFRVYSSRLTTLFLAAIAAL